MKRFLVFYYLDYYPSGGWNDFEDSFDTAEEAIAFHGACQVVDSASGKIIWGEGCEP